MAENTETTRMHNELDKQIQHEMEASYRGHTGV